MQSSHDAANREALERIASVRPVLVGMERADRALGLEEGELGHAGPPFSPGQTPPTTVLNALAGAAMHEGWAGDMNSARRMVLDGEIRLRANHEIGAVSPMAGVVRPGQTLMRLDDANGGPPGYATLAEKGRRVLRFGHYDEAVAAGLDALEQRIAPAIVGALPRGGLEIWPLVARGVEMGDDVHQRNVGGMFSFIAALPGLSESVTAWLADHPQHFLNYAMASAKMGLDRARGVAGSTLVTAITRNGIDCGIQIAGRDGEWFKAPATVPVGGFYEGHGLDDAHPDLGDSAIMETWGLGGCIAHVSPEIARMMERGWDESLEAGARMRSLFIGGNAIVAPALAGDAGVGLGLDARLVAAAPDDGVRIHTGIAHRDGVSGWIGVGVAKAPRACFAAAANAVVEEAVGGKVEEMST